MGEYTVWVIAGIIGIAFMFLIHVLKNKGRLKKTDIAGQTAVASGFAGSISLHAVMTLFDGVKTLAWALVTIPQFGIYSTLINLFVMAIFNTIIHETSKVKST